MIPINAAVIGLALALLVNFGGVIWAAAHFAAAVQDFRVAIKRLDKIVVALDHTVDVLDKRVAILEDRGSR